VVPPTRTAAHPIEPTFDLDLDLRDTRDPHAAAGPADLSGRLRPAGGRRSARHTHTRLIAALARIHAEGAAAGTGERARPAGH